ncbi:glycosyltransferase family 4 protein [Mastigocoleus sp. MO_188.B34]|uniref:glycosyltransferase family 4 protein n=1 Tax=Mastigocoleus sp. MO_188.B34 TaxID=3036635 RepID=UPI002625BE42|nr:glycosyltransferase family 4 protein [Mastigocoleus sp. MO_188.B34]MDJ0696540.1 glycosyltransferase family 4 protein [Mastigocoleus sp. MO_188.B34]
MVKSLLISTYDIQGGAARAAYRLNKGLRNIGVDSKLLAANKLTDDETVIAPQTPLSKGITKLKPTLDTLPLKFFRYRHTSPYSIQWLGDAVPAKVAQIQPDIINLHWVNFGYLQIESISRLGKSIVWTLHDMWAFTGGCHYSFDCERYTNSCGACPQLQSNTNKDLSHWVWQRKQKAWRNLNLTIVTPSDWLAKCARSSSLLKDKRIEVIPNGIDTDKYKPINKSIARSILGLPKDKRFILFGAVNASSDGRKGFHLLEAVLQNLSQTDWADNTELIIFGASKSRNSPKLGFKSHYLGKLNDDISLALVYAAADVFVAPSIQENLANTVMESLSCGTPCVAFNIGGMPDMIENLKNGYLAKPFEVEDLARGIAWVLEGEERFQKLSYCARQKVEREFTQTIQAQNYLNLFNNILSTTNYVNTKDKLQVKNQM